jgi:hypothetical protein
MSDSCLVIGDTTHINATYDVTIDGLALRPGVSLAQYAAIEDSGQHTTLRSIETRNPTGSGTPTFSSIIQIDNDQSAVIEKFDPSLYRSWAHCDTDWCSVAIYGPGPGTPGVLWVKDSNIGAQCMFNGIDNQNANTLRVSDSIVESNPQFSIRARGSYVNPAAVLDNVYMDPGTCQNPLGTGIAGFISEGFFSVVHGMKPGGVLPNFGGSGSGQFNAYYVIVHSSTLNGYSAPYLAGYAYANASGLITVKWPQVGDPSFGGTITYDVIRQSSDLTANSPAPYGSGVCRVAKGVGTASCSNGVCSIPDNGITCDYTVTSPSQYAPSLKFWPGAVILTQASDNAATNPSDNEPKLYADIVGQTYQGTGGYVNSYGANVPTVFAHQCSLPGAWSSIWMSCPAGDSSSSNYKPIGALLLQSGTEASDGTQGGLKGRLNLMSPSSTLPATHLITLGDSNPAKTLATPGHRPTSDANDTWIGLDNGNAVASQFQLAFGAPQFISSYIGNVGDNSNWLERLSTSAKTFAVPVASTVRQGTAPFQVVSTTPVTHLTSQFAQGLSLTGVTGSIGGSQLSSGQCASGTVNITGATTLMTAVASPSGNPLPDSNHGLSIWAFVSAANTVTVEVCAVITTTPVSTTYNVRVSQ